MTINKTGDIGGGKDADYGMRKSVAE